MEYPVYLQMTETENVVAIQGPSRFWEGQKLGNQVLQHDVVCRTWPERQRVMDMLESEGPWSRISKEAFDRAWEPEMTEPDWDLQEHVELASRTTFGISSKARWFARVTTLTQLRGALAWAKEQDVPMLVLGGGSNMLLHGDVHALVLQVDIRGVEVLPQGPTGAVVSAGAGEPWHEFVMRTLDDSWHGLENLSLIPGNVGASPMQNIGAYGVEVKDHFAWLDAVRIEDGALERFDASKCQFGYRDSVFKREERGNWIIVRVAFHLDRESPLRMGYGAIEHELADIPEERRTHRDVSEAVIRIRQSKLPDPAVVGNAGSFFKNPTVPSTVAQALKKAHPSMPQYPQAGGGVKLAAGWLIEQSGWKGHSRETHGVHDRQALVLVHFGGATGQEVWVLAQDVMVSVHDKFGVQLEPEVNQIKLHPTD